MNYVDVELDAYEIADKIFSDNNEFNKNFSFENVDTKTFFEMLLIITVEGLKKFYGNNQEKVDITILSKEDIDKINRYLEKINIKLIFTILDTLIYTLYNSNALLENFTDVNITNETKISSLNYVIKKHKLNLVYIVNFDFV
jgi:hypothetical protein